MKRLLSIWLPNWPIQRKWPNQTRGTKPTKPACSTTQDAQREQPEHQPAILWHQDPRRGRLVVACCSRAAQLGVRPGQPIAQAVEMVLHRNPNGHPVVAEHDTVADSVAIEKLAAQLQHRISPLVAIETRGKRLWSGQPLTQPDTLFCDLSGITHLFQDEHGVLAAVHECLREHGWTGKLAIADNAAAAWALAHHHRDPDFVSTDPLTDLTRVSVDGLRIETEIKYSLDRLGIETIGALLRLPRSGLARRLGKTIVPRIAEILGEVETPLAMHHSDQVHTASHALEYPTTDFEIITHRISTLTRQVVESLTAKQRGALRLSCRLELVDRTQRTNAIGLFAPTLDAEHLEALVCSSLESSLTPSHAGSSSAASPITRITLTVLQSEPLRTRQNHLFAGETPGESFSGGLGDQAGTDQSLAKLVDGLTSRLGRDSVLGVRLSDNPLPEKAYRTYSLTDHRTRRALRRLPSRQKLPRQKQPGKPSPASLSSRGRSNPFRNPSREDARRRPLRLLRTPLRLAVMGSGQQPGSGQQLNGALPPFRFETRVHRVVHFWGPERIETGWWEGPSSRRDYYRVETDSGHLWWIYQDLRNTDQWFLHGRFQ